MPDVHHCIVKIRRPNDHLYYSLKEKKKGAHIFILYYLLDLELERYWMRHIIHILWAAMFSTYINCMDCNFSNQIPISAIVYVVDGLPDD